MRVDESDWNNYNERNDCLIAEESLSPGPTGMSRATSPGATSNSFQELDEASPWFFFMANSIGASDSDLDAFLVALEAYIAQSNQQTEDEFLIAFNNTIKSIKSDSQFSSTYDVYIACRDLIVYFASRSLELRLAFIDKNINSKNSTYNILKATYPAFFARSVTTTSASDTGLTPGMPYCYQVVAADTNGNYSGKSAQACSSTPAARH